MRLSTGENNHSDEIGMSCENNENVTIKITGIECN